MAIGNNHTLEGVKEYAEAMTENKVIKSVTIETDEYEPSLFYYATVEFINGFKANIIESTLNQMWYDLNIYNQAVAITSLLYED